MAKRKKRRGWKFVVGGALAGWLAGIVCEVCLVALWMRGSDDGEVTLALAVTPVYAIFWAIAGVIVGPVTRGVRSPWVPTTAALGAFGAAFYGPMIEFNCYLHDIPILGGMLGFAGGMAGMVIGLMASHWRVGE